MPKGNPDWEGLNGDIGQKQSGGSFGTKTDTVAGGNPPYGFQLDSGRFPPLGMHLGLNRLLYGMPAKPPLGGYKPFRVCAVDLSPTANCKEVKITEAGGGGGYAKPIATGAGGAAAAAAAVAASAGSESAAAGSSCGANPTNPFNDYAVGSLDCAAEIAAYSQWCVCMGYAGGTDTTTSSCVH